MCKLVVCLFCWFARYPPPVILAPKPWNLQVNFNLSPFCGFDGQCETGSHSNTVGRLWEKTSMTFEMILHKAPLKFGFYFWACLRLGPTVSVAVTWATVSGIWCRLLTLIRLPQLLPSHHHSSSSSAHLPQFPKRASTFVPAMFSSLTFVEQNSLIELCSAKYWRQKEFVFTSLHAGVQKPPLLEV